MQPCGGLTKSWRKYQTMISQRNHNQSFYRYLKYVTNPIIDEVWRIPFNKKQFTESMTLLDEASKNNRAWYTRYEEVGDLGYTFELSAEQKNREEERDKYMAHMRTQ